MTKTVIKLRPRKVTSINYSFFVTLPLDWIEHHKICRGDLISFELTENGNLVLKPKKEKKK